VRKLARGLLRLLPQDDPLLRLDRERLERVLARRAEQCAARAGQRGADAGRRGCADRRPDGRRGARRPARHRHRHGPDAPAAGRAADTAVGIDISREMLVLARSNLHAAGLDHLSVRQGNMYQLRFADGSFDTVTIDQVLYQAEQPVEVLREAARVLRPGGRLLLVEFLTGERGRRPPRRASPITARARATGATDAGLQPEAVESLRRALAADRFRVRRAPAPAAAAA
jgi:SAM-dependent methyltransferase